MKTIYIAGPYSHGDVAENVNRAMWTGMVLIKEGYAPFIPHLHHFLECLEPQSYECWMAVDQVWLEKCDVFIRLPGYSPGADVEEQHARRLNIPVYRELDVLLAALKMELVG